MGIGLQGRIMANWELCNAIRQSSMKRIVEDGNLIQQLISKIDLQISTDQKSEAVETMQYMQYVLEQLDADFNALCNAMDD